MSLNITPMKIKSSFAIYLIVFASALTDSCKDESLVGGDSVAGDAKVNSKTTSGYIIDLSISESTDGSVWKYTLTKDGAKDPGHFIINFGNCGDESPTIANIVSASVNGMDWSDKISNSEGKGTGCNVTSTNFVKFDDLLSADRYEIEFTLDTIYSPVSTTGWVKAGRTCLPQEITGPGCRGYRLTTSMNADSSMAGKNYNELNTYMKRFGYDYSEHPNCTGGYGGHPDGIHGSVEQTSSLNKPVFRFDIHIDPVIDGDRCSSGTVDRQRNEMKSITNNSTWAKVQGNWDEWQILEWKFKLPQGFQPTTSFCHIHQLKAQDGSNNGSPLITITPRANSDGSNKRIQIIHSVDGASTGKGTVVNNIPLSDFEGEWVQVQEKIHYIHEGYYSCRIIRIRDGKVLLDFTDSNIDMWRIGSSYIRHKYGIYRSLAGGQLDEVPVGQSPLLKNESLWFTDFKVYEKNSSAQPGVPHN
jgi:hypothetical protein